MPADAAATRARILAAARRLLNARGLLGVTVRSIAAVAGISHGNLCYHYKNVGAIVAALVDELAAASDAQIAAVELGMQPLVILAELQHATFSLMAQYRFFFADYVAVVRALPKLRSRLKKIKQRREEQFVAFLSLLRAAGLMRAEPRPGDDGLLFRQYDLVADFWISQAQIVFGTIDARAQRHYEVLAMSLLAPHLTEAGMQQYDAVLSRLRGSPAA